MSVLLSPIMPCTRHASSVICVLHAPTPTSHQGPGEYLIPTFVDSLRGLSFERNTTGSDLDVRMKTAAAIPGPANYSVSAPLSKVSATFGSAPVVSLLEEAMRKGAAIPGTLFSPLACLSV